MTSPERMFFHAEVFGEYGRCVSFRERDAEFGSSFEDVGCIRFLNASDQMIADIMVADARHALWRTGRRVRHAARPVRDPVPLRFWLPGRFVEPIIRQSVLGGTEPRFARLWRWAPFEVVFDTPPARVLEYEFFVSRSFYRFDGGEGVRNVTQVTRFLHVFESCSYTIKRRWFSLS